MTHLSQSRKSTGVLLSLVSLSILFLIMPVLSQTSRKLGSEDEPLFHEYRGVQLGWLSDEVRKKLGSPTQKSEEQDFYVFNDKEMAQILYDKATHKVIAISVDFTSGAQNVPTPQQVFGADIDAKPDGSKYKLVRYPKAGFWLSYSRTAGDSPLVTVTMQKMAQ
jgi:ABC-type microcin C transport system permease subunit YejE